MPAAPIPENEEQRLAELRRLEILDSAAERAYDDLTLLASQICGTPIALVSLIDSRRQWFKSRIGIDISEGPREHAFCAHAIHQTEPMIVEDALADPRFRHNPLVTSDPHIRFYAGVPLSVRGLNLGTLCVIDREPRRLSDAQKQALEALGRQAARNLAHRRFRQIVETFLDQMPVCLAAKDDALRYVFVNAEWRTAFASYGDPIGKTSREWLGSAAAEEAERREADLIAKNERELSTEDVLGLPGRTWIVSRFPVENLSGARGIGIVAIDDTERVATDANLREAERQLEHARRVETLGMLASTVSHEFNNVLAGIMPYADLLRRAPLPAARQVAAGEAVASSVERGARLVQQILRYGRPAEPLLTQINLTQWLSDRTPLLRSMAGPSITIDLSVPATALRVDADGDQLDQVLANLVTNARDAIGSGAGRIEIRLDQIDGFAHISVSDSGPRLPPDVLPKIFDPLFTTKRIGTGIGLAVCRHIVERHGGAITAENDASGTSLHIRLPISP